MDYAHNLTDKKLKALENKISKEYKKAAKTAEKKLKDYLDGFKKQDIEWKKKVASGEKTKAEYLKWRQSKIAAGGRWKDVRDNLAQDMTNANKIAMSAVREHMPEVYALNHNFGTFEVEEQSMLNTSYALYDRYTVERLFRESPALLPKPRVDIPKDLRWNRQKIQSTVIQGLLLGESMDGIATRMQDVTDMNRKAAIRNARTAVTSAENGGRMDSYKRAESMGIKMMKQWLSTPDGRTRDSHVEVDGETVGIHENFSNGLSFPGDPGGPPEEVYNCRCTLVGVLDKVEHDSSGRFMRLPSGQSYEEWRNSKRKQPSAPAYNKEGWLNRLRRQSLSEYEKWTKKWLKQISEGEQDGVHTYTSNAYQNMNDYLRGFREKTRYADEIKLCTDALEKASLPEDVIVRRGANSDMLDAVFGRKNSADALEASTDWVEGSLFFDKGFLSTSPDPEGGFSDDIEFVINCPKGSHGMYVDPISAYQGENELLLQRGSMFYVHEVEIEKDDWGGIKYRIFMSLFGRTL